MSCFYDLAERYRHRNLIAERDSDSRGVLTPWIVPRTFLRYACSASCFASVAKQFPKEADELFAAAQENAQWRYKSYLRMLGTAW